MPSVILGNKLDTIDYFFKSSAYRDGLWRGHRQLRAMVNCAQACCRMMGRRS